MPDYERPNVLLIHTDQQRWDALGANGNADIYTPNLDRLAAEGVNFDRYFVNAPVCMPSRASYLTGQYPSQLSIYGNGVKLPEDALTLPRMLDNQGYTSGNLGKLHFLPHANRDHRTVHPDYGFDELEISDEPGVYPDAHRKWVAERAPEQLDEIAPGLPPMAEEWPGPMGLEDIDHPDERFPKEPIPFGADADLTHTAFVADRTLDFLERHADDEPFLGIAGFYSPHSPWVAPEEFLDLYDPADLSLPEFPAEVAAERGPGTVPDEELRAARHGYYAMVSEVDHHVGRLLERLNDLGLRENTLVVFTSDHGEWLGEHLRYGKGWPGHDPVTRVPFVVRWPDGLEEPGRTVSGIAEATDLVPTLLDCCGVQVPPHLRGRSLRPALDAAGWAGRDGALMEARRGKALRTGDYRYTMARDGSEALYDLTAEHGSYRDVSDDEAHEDALATHRRRLLARLTDLDAATERDLDWAY